MKMEKCNFLLAQGLVSLNETSTDTNTPQTLKRSCLKGSNNIMCLDEVMIIILMLLIVSIYVFAQNAWIRTNLG